MPERLYALVGETIRKRRDALHLTQEVLAARLGLSRASIANIEQGRQSLALHQLYRAAEALETSIQELLPTYEPERLRRQPGRSVDLDDLLIRLEPMPDERRI